MLITYVKDSGPFIKIYGRIEAQRQEFAIVQTLVNELVPNLYKTPSPQISEIDGDVCIASSGGQYKRIRIVNLSEKGFASVHYIDYGNKEIISINEIRLLKFDHPKVNTVRERNPCVSEYILAEVYGQWNQISLENIRRELCNKDVLVKLKADVSGSQIIDITYNSSDYSKKLLAHNLGNLIFLNHQIELVREQRKEALSKQFHNSELLKNLNHNRMPIKKQQPLPSSPPQPLPYQQANNIPPHYQSHSGILQSTPSVMQANPNYRNSRVIVSTKHMAMAYVPKPTILSPPMPTIMRSPQKMSPLKSPVPSISVFKSNTLRIGSTHEVFCSFIEDGPLLFSIQLANDEDSLNNLMAALDTIELQNLTNKPSLGMACIARYSADNNLYRGVVMNISTSSCLVGYVDYGNSEKVAFNNIYEIPKEFLKQKVFAMKFTLSGYKELQPLTNAMKRKFEDLVMDQKLTLKVTQLEGPAFVQYCELYQGKSNIFHELKNIPKTILKYSEPKKLEKNDTDVCIIRYVDTPQKLFLQIINDTTAYDLIMDRLHLHCQKASKLRESAVGTICAAQYEDGDWYRSEIIDILPDDRVIVKYVDYGNTQNVSKDALRELTAEFTILPRQAIQCCLKGFENLATVSDNSRVQLEMLAEDENGDRKRLKLQVIDVPSTGIPLINLIDEHIDPPLNIAKRVIKLSSSLKSQNTNPDLQSPKKQKTQSNDTFKPFASPIRDDSHTASVATPSAMSHATSDWNTTQNSNLNQNSHLTSNWDSTITNNNNRHVTSNWDSTQMSKSTSFASNKKSSSPGGRLNDSQESLKSSSSSGKQSGAKSKNNRENQRQDPRQDQPPPRQRVNRDPPEGRIYHPPHERNSRDRGTIGGDNLNKNAANGGYDYNRSTSRENFSREKNSSDGRKFDNSDSSGKFSQSTGKSERKSAEIAPAVLEEFEPFDSQFIEPNIILNKREDIFMSWWTSPNEFFIYYKNVQNNLERLMKDLQKFYKNRPPTKQTPTNGSSIVARYAKDSLFYRARILNSNPDLKKYRVEFIDFGNKSIVTLDNVWEVERQFMKVPRIAISCSLIGIILNVEQTAIIDKIDLYLTKESAIQCEFLKTENSINYVDVYVNGNNLRESFIKDNLVLSLPDSVNLMRLVGQTMQLKYISITDLSNFSVKIDGCDVLLMCSYTDVNYAKQNIEKSTEFKTLYENLNSPARIDDVTRNNILLVTPLIPILEETQCPTICELPIISNKFNATVMHVEAINLIYVQKPEINDLLSGLLEDMFSFYETQGTEIKHPTTNNLCAMKSFNGDWYRGYIESIDETKSDESSKYKVRCIDYGNTEDVPKMNLKFLEKNHTIQSALASKIYLPHAKVADADETDVFKSVSDMTLNYNIQIEICQYLNGCWFGEVKNEGHCLSDVLIGRNCVRRLENDEIELLSQQELEKRVQHLTEFNFEHQAAEVVNPIIPVAPKFEGINAFVVHSDDPETIYLQLESDGPNIDKMQCDIQIIAESLQELEVFTVGTLCIAKYNVDNVWYRAKILDHGDAVTSILYIDFGNSDVITNNIYLRAMPEAFEKLEPYAILCSLPIYPAEGVEWSAEANATIFDTFDNVVMFDFISKNGKKKYINLFCDGKDICKSLIASGLAKPYDVIKSGEKCFISHNVSLSEFYIQLESSTLNLELMEDFLADFEKFPVVEKAEEGIIVSARFPEDNNWYRARHLYHNDTSSMVHFIDYGNQALVTEIRNLPDDIRNLPTLSHKCSLYLPKNITIWSEEAEQKFIDLQRTGETIFNVEMEEPGLESTIVHLSINGRDILEDLEPLCQVQQIVHFDMSMTESVMEKYLAPSKKLTEINNKVDEILDGYVCYANSPSDFYIHYDCDKEKLYECEDYLEAEKTNLTPVTNAKEGELYVAECEEDCKLYRARVVGCTNDGYEVCYVDWGNTSFTKKLFQLPSQYANASFWAKHCSLYVEYAKNVWNEESSSKFAEMTDNYRVFQIEIINQHSDPMKVVIHDGETRLNDQIVATLNSTTMSVVDHNEIPSITSNQLQSSEVGSNFEYDETNSNKSMANNIIKDVISHVNSDIENISNEMANGIVDGIMSNVGSEISKISNQISSSVVDDVLTDVCSHVEKIAKDNSKDIINDVLTNVDKTIDAISRETSEFVINDVLNSVHQKIRKVSSETSHLIIRSISAESDTANEQISHHFSPILDDMNIYRSNNIADDNSFEHIPADDCNNPIATPFVTLNERKERNLEIWSSLEQLGYDNHRKSTNDLLKGYTSKSSTSLHLSEQ